MISHMSQKMLTGKKNLVTDRCENNVFYWIGKKELGEPFNGYTFISFPTLIPTAVSPQLSEFVMERRPLAIYSARGKTLFAKKEICKLFHADEDTMAHIDIQLGENSWVHISLFWSVGSEKQRWKRQNLQNTIFYAQLRWFWLL